MDKFGQDQLRRMGFNSKDRLELRSSVLNQIYNNANLWVECWQFTDAYGQRGTMPPQGYDWSGFRDSTYSAIRAMADYLGLPMDYPLVDRR